jgi:HEAT repeat protein
MAVQRTTADQRYAVLAQRTTDLLRDHYRLIPQPTQKEELLRRWLGDPLVVYRLAALTIISEEIQEGRLPTAPVIEGVVQGLTHRSPEIRRAVLGILGALSDPANTGAVLALLDEERDASVRQTAFRVLGQLRNPEALSAVVDEIRVTTGRSAPSGCVAEAAAALALIGAKGKLDAAALADAIPVLQERYAQTPVDNGHLRASLLRAMVSIGADDFGPIFREALGSDLPDELLPAVEGCEILRDTASLERILPLAGHGDPRVRVVAVRAIGNLGGAPAHMEVLYTRLNPGTESNEGVRVAAWAAWRELVETKPPSEQLQWADRLGELPDRYVEALDTLIASLTGHNPPAAELAEARRRLGTFYSESGNHAEALPVWQQLHGQLRAANDGQADDVAIVLLTEALAANQGAVITETLTLLATAKPSVKARAGRVVTDFINANRPQAEPDALYALVEAVAAAPLDEYDAAFRTFIADARQQLTPPRPTPTTEPATEG